MPPKEPVIAAASLCVVAVLAGCSAASSSGESSSADPSAPTTVHSAVPSAAHSARAAVAVTVAGGRTDAHRFYERLGFVASHEGMKLILDRE
jgi:hypothetical protein